MMVNVFIKRTHMAESAPVRTWEVGKAQQSECWEDSHAAHVNILLCDAARN